MTNLWVPPDNNLAIEIKNLSKIYKNSDSVHPALNNISLKIKCGSFFGLLGPNGAGKSTLINIIAGTTIKSEGNVKIWDLDIDRFRKQSKLAVGIVPQELNIDAFFTPVDQLELQAGLFGVPKNKRITSKILDLMDLTTKSNAYSRNLSGGMRRRLLVAKAMVHSPPILILDEPTAGVDVELRKKLWQNFKELNDIGVTIILTTHYLEEAENLCNEIAIIHKGKIAAQGQKNQLLSKIDQKILIINFQKKIEEKLKKEVMTFGEVDFNNQSCNIKYKPSKVTINDVFEFFRSKGIKILDIKTRDITLEDVFLMLTKD